MSCYEKKTNKSLTSLLAKRANKINKNNNDNNKKRRKKNNVIIVFTLMSYLIIV